MDRLDTRRAIWTCEGHSGHAKDIADMRRTQRTSEGHSGLAKDNADQWRTMRSSEGQCRLVKEKADGDMDRNVQVDGEDGTCTKRRTRGSDRSWPWTFYVGHRQWTLVMFAADERATDTGWECRGWQVRGWALTDGGQEGYGRWIRGSRTIVTRVTDEIEEGKDGRWLRGSEDGWLGLEERTGQIRGNHDFSYLCQKMAACTKILYFWCYLST